MDFKGATWVGNVYQKFEAMCLEVEETMYQDTVKFVENEVQNVGLNMKKFYSDVMQDLIPPSSTDPVKLAIADLPLNPYADTGTHKNPKASIKEDTKKVDELFAKNLKVIDEVDGDQVSSLDGLHKVNHMAKSYSRRSIKGSYSMKNEDGEKYEHASQTTSSKNQVLDTWSRSSSVNWSRSSSVSDIIKDYAANDQMVMTSPQASVVDEVVGWDSREEEKEGKSCDDINGADLVIDNCSVDDPISDIILSPKSKGRKGRKPRCKGEGLAAESIVAETCLLIDSYVNGDTQNSQSAGGEAFLLDPGRPGNCDTDAIEKNYSTEPRMETIKQDDETKLEETCVLVDGNNLPFVSLKEGRQWSYKKKMREAFTLKKKSGKRQEYEKLVTQYADTDMKPSLTSVDCMSPDSNTAKLKTHEVCESEWEFL